MLCCLAEAGPGPPGGTNMVGPYWNAAALGTAPGTPG